MTILDDIPDLVNGAFGDVFYDAVMTVDVPQDSPDPADPLPPVPTSFGCKAYVTKYSAYYRANSLVREEDRKVIVLAKSLAIPPVIGARITVQGVPFSIISFDDGGSNRSIWEIQGRLG